MFRYIVLKYLYRTLHFTRRLCSGVVSSTQVVCGATLSSIRPRRAADQLVPGFRAVRHARQHVGDVVYSLHAHRTGVRDL